MMKCPACSARMHVLDSRGRPKFITYRRYQCACGKRYNSYEFLIVKPTRTIEMLKAAYERARNMIDFSYLYGGTWEGDDDPLPLTDG